MSLRKWQHPTTGEIRIYVNDPCCIPCDSKLWLTAWPNQAGLPGDDLPEIHSRGLNHQRAVEIVNSHLVDVGLSANATWEQVLTVAEAKRG